MSATEASAKVSDPSYPLNVWEGLALATARDAEGQSYLVGTNKWSAEFAERFRARVAWLRSNLAP